MQQKGFELFPGYPPNYSPDGPVGELLQLPVQRFLDVALRVQIDRRVELLMHQTTLHGGHLLYGKEGFDLLHTAVRLIIFPLLQFDCTQIKQVVVESDVKGKSFLPSLLIRLLLAIFYVIVDSLEGIRKKIKRNPVGKFIEMLSDGTFGRK